MKRLILKMCVVLALIVAASACKKPYVRPAEKINLGKVGDFLGPYRHVQASGVLVYRDEKGWSALGTRCTYDGCDLTYQPRGLVCPCCGSVFDAKGKPVGRPAKKPLSWYSLEMEEAYLFAFSGNIVPEDYRFNSPEMQKLAAELQERAQKEFGKGNTTVPKLLQGGADGEGGVMFVEPKPQDLKKLYDINPTP